MEVNPEVFKKSIHALLKLQKVDAGIFKLNAEEESPSGDFREVKIKMAEAQKALRIAERAFREIDRERRAIELKLITLQEDLSKAEGKRKEVRNTTEEFSANKEVENFGTRIRDAKAMMAERVVIVDAKAANRDEKKSTFDELEKKSNEMQAARDELLQGISEKRQKLLAKRDAYIAEVEDIIFTMYERVQKHRRGSGVAVVEDGTCQACFVSVPPQVNLKLERQNEIITCPSCSRILYPPELQIDVSEEGEVSVSTGEVKASEEVPTPEPEASSA